MSRPHTSWRPLAITGLTATVAGVALIGAGGGATVTIWLGASVLVLGLLTTVITTFNAKPAAAALHPPVTDRGGSVSGGACGGPAIGELTACFSRWLEQHEGGDSLWPAFDRWVRDALNQFIQARRVRCFRRTPTGDRLASLTGDADDAFWAGVPRHSLIDHVAASGRRYIRGAPDSGGLVERLASEWAAHSSAGKAGVIPSLPPDYLLPILDRGRTVGLIVVGELPEEKLNDLPVLHAVGHLLELVWRHVEQAETLAFAQRTDQASGVLNRMDLTLSANRVMQESASDNEPVVVLALSVEGVRRLDDQEQWAVRDWLMKQIGPEMQRRLRSDDLVGRFSDDRFVAVLRRLDISLGQLIADKVLEAVKARVHQQPLIRQVVKLRCGLAEGPADGFDPVLARAFSALREARKENQEMVIAPIPGRQDAGTRTEVNP